MVFVASPLSTQHQEERKKDWLARNKYNVAEWGDMSIRGVVFQ